MKCPYCNRELERDGNVIQCSDIDCRHLHNLYGSYELWQELTKTKQLLGTIFDNLDTVSQEYFRTTFPDQIKQITETKDNK